LLLSFGDRKERRIPYTKAWNFKSIAFSSFGDTKERTINKSIITIALLLLLKNGINGVE